MSRKAEPEEEMTELPRQEMNTALLDNLEDERTTPPKQRGLKIRDWMRQLRLQILLIRIGRPSSLRNSAERRKVAIHHNRRLAILHVLLHLIPLGGAIALLYLQWSSFFLSFTSPADSTVLQFVAKFHELLMQVSIVEITVCIIRTEALRNFVPLGALSAIAQVTQLSYIWSLDFISLFVSPALYGWRRVLFAIAIPTLLISTALVGPSSAVLMIPRSGSARDGGAFTFYTNASYEQLLPSTIGRANGLQFNWKLIGTSLEYDLRKRSSVDNNTVIEIVSEYGSPDSHPGLPRPVRSRVNRTSESGFNSPDVGISNATVPTGFVRQGFNELSFWGVSHGGKLFSNYTLSVYAPQPVVQVICSTASKTSWKTDAEVRYVQDYTLRTATISTLGMLTQKLNDSGEMFVNDDSTTIQSFEPVWMAAPEPGSQAWIGIFFQHVYDVENKTVRTEPIKLSEMVSLVPSFQRYGWWEVSTCTINASWNNSEAIYFEEQAVAYRNLYPMPPWTTRALKPIVLDYDDIDELRDPKFLKELTSRNLVLSGGLSGALAVSLTDAISDIPKFSYNLTWDNDAVSTGVSNMSIFRFICTWYGFGYGNHSTSVCLSMAVLCFYCVVTVLYLAYMLFTGRSSTAWNSSIELVALALQSKRPDHLGNVSVGIDNLSTFNEGVGIRANADNELELVFAHDRDIGSRGLRKVQTNKEYWYRRLWATDALSGELYMHHDLRGVAS